VRAWVSAWVRGERRGGGTSVGLVGLLVVAVVADALVEVAAVRGGGGGSGRLARARGDDADGTRTWLSIPTSPPLMRPPTPCPPPPPALPKLRSLPFSLPFSDPRSLPLPPPPWPLLWPLPPPLPPPLPYPPPRPPRSYGARAAGPVSSRSLPSRSAPSRSWAQWERPRSGERPRWPPATRSSSWARGDVDDARLGPPGGLGAVGGVAGRCAEVWAAVGELDPMERARGGRRDGLDASLDLSGFPALPDDEATPLP
jgi:hypothetical protein